MKTNAQDPATFYNTLLSGALKSIKNHNAKAVKDIGKWCATVLAKDDELLRWIIECSRDGYSVARRKKLAAKLRWMAAEDYHQRSIKCHASFDTWFGSEVVGIKAEVMRDYHLSLGIPFSAFTSKAGYQEWRESKRAEAEKKKADQLVRDRKTYEELKARFEP